MHFISRVRPTFHFSRAIKSRTCLLLLHFDDNPFPQGFFRLQNTIITFIIRSPFDLRLSFPAFDGTTHFQSNSRRISYGRARRKRAKLKHVPVGSLIAS